MARYRPAKSNLTSKCPARRHVTLGCPCASMRTNFTHRVVKPTLLELGTWLLQCSKQTSKILRFREKVTRTLPF